MADVLNKARGASKGLLVKGQGFVDSVCPPEERAEWRSRVEAFMRSNPRLSAFLLINIALTGVPLLLFTAFTTTVFVSSVLVVLLLGLVTALLFTSFCVGFALIILLPTVFMTTLTATFIFLWSLAGYHILKWHNERSSRAAKHDAVGGKAVGARGRSDSAADNSWKSEFDKFDTTRGDVPALNGDTQGEGDGRGGTKRGLQAVGNTSEAGKTFDEADATAERVAG